MLFGKYNGQHTKQKKAGKSRKGRERARGANDLGTERGREGITYTVCDFVFIIEISKTKLSAMRGKLICMRRGLR